MRLLAVPLTAAIALVELHGPDGQTIYVNPAEVTSVREPRSAHLRHFVPGTRCVIVMANGNLIAVNDTCVETRSRLEGK